MGYLSIATWVSDGLVVFASLVGVRVFVVLALWVLIANISRDIERGSVSYSASSISQLQFRQLASAHPHPYHRYGVALP